MCVYCDGLYRGKDVELAPTKSYFRDLGRGFRFNPAFITNSLTIRCADNLLSDEEEYLLFSSWTKGTDSLFAFTCTPISYCPKCGRRLKRDDADEIRD